MRLSRYLGLWSAVLAACVLSFAAPVAAVASPLFEYREQPSYELTALLIATEIEATASPLTRSQVEHFQMRRAARQHLAADAAPLSGISTGAGIALLH